MEYSKIIAVTGMPGLYELLTSKSDGAIVRSLEDKSTKFVSSRIHNFSHLESIEVFTVRENVNLVDIFHAMEKDEVKIPDGKDNAALKKYFDKVYPDLDFERVYSSDLKKMVKWFEVLKANEIEIKLSQAPAEETEAEGVSEIAFEEVEKVGVEEKKPKELKEEKKPKELKEEKKPKEVKEEKQAPAKKAAAKAKASEPKGVKETKEVKPKKSAPKKKKEDK
ncbi:MAG: DUF5606 domain-containing protein [Chitinophagaceae bacterium]|nr:DUF5606 domain-containing protein [Chitinophagaceae bacterium]